MNRGRGLVFVLVVALAGCSGTSAEDDAVGTAEQPLQLAPIVPVADTTLQLASGYASFGTSATLDVSSASVASLERSLIRFDQSAITAAVGTQALYSARIELTVSSISDGWLGGQIEIMRMTRSWPEGNGLLGHGPSWVCADDTDTTLLGNLVNNCTSANNWGMLPTDPYPRPFNTVATDRSPVFTGGLNVIDLDVTQDVQRFLSGQPNYGWIIAGTGGPLSGALVSFVSREGATKPRLILEAGPDQCPQDPLKGIPGQCGCGVLDTDANFDGVADCVDAVVTATADTTVRLAVPFGNDGTGTLLGVTSASIAGLERSLVRVDQSAIDAVRAGRAVDAAYLELTVAGIAAGWGGGRIEIAPMVRSWPEGNGLAGHGPSWFCADDQDTTLLGNASNDCRPGDAWSMDFWQLVPTPFAPTPTDSQPVFTLSTRSVRFDVTADVQRFISGDPNFGWIVKGTADLLSGEWVNFGSRESGAPPRLLLDLSPLCSPGVTNCPPGSDRDTDGDRTRDKDDPCVLDPNKVDPLLCGCNESEADDDHDTVPNCFDPCPQDPNNQSVGACGCAGQTNLQPVGTPCVVEACSGSWQEATCNGQGVCGDPACPPIAGSGNCFFKVFRDRGYWFCNGPVSWDQAEAACNRERGRSLVEVDDRLENLWLSNVLTGDAWLGGNALANGERWFWSSNGAREGKLFWADGLPVPGRFQNWAFSKPESNACATMLSDATWSDRSCSTAQGFVCEQPVLRLPPRLATPDKCKFYPNIPCPSRDEIAADEPCVEPSAAGLPDTGDPTADFAAMQAKAVECTTNCPTETSPGCPGTFCDGFATPPPPGDCPAFTAEERALCSLESIHPSATCSVDNPACPTGYTCGKHYECAALDANHQPHSCTSDADCSAGQVCGKQAPYCMDPSKHDKCADRDGEECIGLCFGSFACGIPDDECALNDDNAELGRCSDTLLCSNGPDEPDTNPLLDPASNLTEQEFNPDTFFPTPTETPADYPLAKPDGCGGDGEPPCNFPTGDHPWCRFNVDVNEKPQPRSVSDSDPAFGDKRGTSGSSGPIQFDFDPNLSLSYNVTDPLPLGDAKFNVSAEASAAAGVHFNLFGFNGGVSLLDALAKLEVDRCGLVADARLRLLGHDFLPALMGDSYDLLDDVDTSATDRQKCEDALQQIQTAVNRAQKALRDAQELIRQETELVANGNRFQSDLCHQLLESGSKGVPVDFPSASAPFAGCGSLTPDQTINLFVRYYREQVNNLIAKQADLLSSGTPTFPVATIPFLDQGGTSDDAHRETQELANINFTIGPIPMNLTLEVYVQYGISGALTFSLTPERLLTAYRDDSQVELADVDASVAPFAGAGVDMFVGVGFDFGALSAKVGISGEVNLGTITLPLYAGAGVGVQPEIDPRPLPVDLASMVASTQLLFPPGSPKKYRFDSFYKFGATASVQDILTGQIFGKVRVKFFFFSKTWRKRIASFKSSLSPIDVHLVSGQNGSDFAQDFGVLGAVRMPIAFVDLKEVDPPPPLPPLPPDGGTGGSGTGGSSGTGGTGGTGGSAGSTGNGGSRVSLLVLNQSGGDPRLIPFDSSRVDELFYDGYCACGAGGAECKADLDCCGTAFCVFDDRSSVSKSSCVQCVAETTVLAGGGQQCTATSECCQSDPQGRNVLCYPFFGPGQTYCQACRGQDEPVRDDNNDGIADFNECCDGLHVFHGPNNASPVCSSCRGDNQSCNTGADCCRGTCTNNSCEPPVR